MSVFIAAVFCLVSVAQEGNCGEVCQTPACINTAARVTESINVSPCDDFYEFACRGWIMKNPIPPNEHIISMPELVARDINMKLREIVNSPDDDGDGKPIKLVRALYRTCMDADSIQKLGLKPLHDTLTKLGLPHTPPSDEEAKDLDISKIVGLANRLYNVGVFFTINIAQNLSDSTKNQLTIQQRSPGFDNSDIYFRQPTISKNILSVYSKYADSLFMVGGAGDKSKAYTTELTDFMTKIAKIMAPLTERVSGTYSRSVVTIDKLQEITDPQGETWNWTKYFKGVFEQTDVIVDPKTDNVFLFDVDYIKNMVPLLKETPPGTIARYIWWHVIFVYWELSVHSFSKLPREHVCLTIVNKYFESALTAAYVKKHFDVQHKKNAMEMWADLNSTFDEMIDELDWMDAETKAHAHTKLHAARLSLGYPEWITNPEELNKYYEPFEVFEGRLFDTYTHYESIQGRRVRNSWKQVPDKNKRQKASTSMTAIYVAHQNTIEIGAGFLHLPFYGNAVESLNYGSVGLIMGSQLMQTIDNYGGETDENGVHRRWWSAKTSQSYVEKIGCIMKQYTDLVITNQGHNFKLNELQIQRGSIANMAGLKIAFRAYKKFKARSAPQQVLPTLDKYTDEQLLFLGFAQTFCGSATAIGLNQYIHTSPFPPHRYIVIGTLQNSDEFAKAWNCSRDSPMNPKKTCTTIW